MLDIPTRGEKDTLDAFKSLLVGRVLSYRQAEVYVTLISLGQASASEIFNRIKNKPKVAGLEKISKPAVYNILDELEERSFVKSAVTPGTKSNSKPYRPVPPDDALEEYFNQTDDLKDTANQVVTLMELKEKQGKKTGKQDIWMHGTKKIALREGLKHLESAKKTILMYCNDYSWTEEPGVTDLLIEKINDGIDVKILGKQPASTLRGNLIAFDAVRRETTIPCNPYCVVDDEHLLTFLNDGFSPKLLVTRNTYMVMRHSAQFSEIWENYSKRGVG